MISPELPAGYSARPLRLDDAQRVTDLIAAYEEAVLGEVLIELEDIQADWQRPSNDLAELSTGVLAGDQLVAAFELSMDKRGDGCVHPDHWGRGIGTALLQWTWQVGREKGLDRVGQTIPDADTAGQALCTELGYERRHTSWVLAMPPHTTIAEVALPDGYALRDLVPGQDEHAAFRVIEDAFNEWEGREPHTYEDWAAAVLARPGFEPWQLRLATSPDGAVVGACLLQLSDHSGWVDQIAVERGHRGKRLAQAMLSDAFAAARAHGRDRAELSTDSRTGALGLYQHLGMQVTAAFTHWAKRL